MKQTFTAILAIFLLTAGAAVAAPLAEVNTDASGVYFLPADAGDYQLTVSGPDGFYHRQTSTGTAPSFRAVDGEGQALADGTYTYELVALPGKPAEGDRSSLIQKRAQSGAFTISGGNIVDPDLTEEFEKAQTIATDLIVQGSACVGFDCTSSESFGFDTLRLKENNLRIHFDDTSSSASFPGNDWRLQANDSSNGGANYFSIEDATAGKTPFKVEAGAPNNTLYVEDDGDVGVGTSNPVVRMHLVKGDSPTLRLEQDGSSGFTPQSWDLAGNETNFFVRDVTNGSKLPFRIKPGAPTDALFVAADGAIGLGTDAPKAALHVLDGGSVFSALSGTAAMFQNNAAASDGVFVSLLSGNTGTAQLSFGDTDNQFAGRVVYEHSNGDMDVRAESRVQFQTNGVDRVTINDGTGSDLIETTTGAVLTNAGVWQSVSRRDAKTNIAPLSAEDALAAFAALEPVTYNYKVEPNDQSVGFIAEDVPDLVATASHKTLASLDLIALLTKVVQEQQKMIDDLAQKMSDIE